MSSVDWGWKIRAGNLLSIMTDLKPAPQKFLEVVLCGCKYASVISREIILSYQFTLCLNVIMFTLRYELCIGSH